MGTCLLLVVACGDGEDPVAAERSEQLRTAAIEAGLPDDVAELLGRAGSATGATYEVTYAGQPGDPAVPDEPQDELGELGEPTLVVAQRPPDRRVDVRDGDRLVERRLVRGTVAYLCVPLDDTAEADADADEAVTCQRDAGAIQPAGTFTDAALDQLVDALADATGTYELTVEERSVAGTTASCLVTTLRAGEEAPDRGSVGTLCLSPEGVQLLVDSGGERLEATAYRTAVDPSSFEPGR